MSFDPITAVTDLIKTGLDKFVADKMSETEKEKLKADMSLHVMEQSRNEESDFRRFIVEYEGAMSDVIKVPIVGAFIMFLRAVIRPLFTVLVGYMDYLYFTAATTSFTAEHAALLKTVNIIVLVFWFGEKAVVRSGIIDMFKAKLEK